MGGREGEREKEGGRRRKVREERREEGDNECKQKEKNMGRHGQRVGDRQKGKGEPFT